MAGRRTSRHHPPFGTTVRETLDDVLTVADNGDMHVAATAVARDEKAGPAAAVVEPEATAPGPEPVAADVDVAAPVSRAGLQRRRRRPAPIEAGPEAAAPAVAEAEAVEVSAAEVEVVAAGGDSGSSAATDAVAELRLAVEQLRADLEAMRPYLRRRIAEGYEVPILGLLAVVLVAAVVVLIVTR